MKIVKVKDSRRYGIAAITEVGAIKPSIADGTFELEDDKAKILVEGDDSFVYAEDYVEQIEKPIKKEEDIKPKSKVNEFVDLDADEIAELEQLKAEQTQLQGTVIQKSEPIVEQIAEIAAEDHLEDIIEEDESVEVKEYRAVLSSKTKAELTKLAQAFPGGEWRAFTKEPLIEYLIGKTK